MAKMAERPKVVSENKGWLTEREMGGLAILLLVGFSIRLYNSAGPSLSFDELWSVYLTRLPFDEMLGLVSRLDVHPPLYYILLRGVTAIGTSEIIYRLSSTLFDLAALVPLYLLGRRLVGIRAAWIACGIFTISSLHVIYAQNVRMYTLQATLFLLSYALLWRLLNEERPPRWVYPAYLLSSAPTLYLNNFAALLLATQAIILLAIGRNRRSFIRMGILWAIIGLIYLPWLATLLTQFKNNTTFNTPSLVELLISFISMAGADHVNGPLHFNLLVIENPWMLVGLVVITFAGIRQLTARPRELTFLLIFWAAPLLISWTLSQLKPVYADRAFMACSFAYFLIIGSAFNSFGQPRNRAISVKLNYEKALIVIGASITGLMMLVSLVVLLGGGYIRQDIRGMTITAAVQLANSPGGRAYLHFTAFVGSPTPVFDYYSPSGATPAVYGFPAEVEQRLSRGPGRVCGVFSALTSTYTDPATMNDPLLQIASLERFLASRPTSRLILDSLFPDAALQLRCWEF